MRQFDEGWDTAQSISDPWERIHALREVAVAQMDAKDTVQAAAKLAEVRITIETIGFASWFFEDLIEELLRIAKAQGQLGDTLAARTTLAAGLNYQPDIDEHFYKAEAMISVAFAQASTQDLKPAQKTLKSARDTAMKIEGSQQQAETLSAIATAQAKLSEFDEAWETIKSIKFDREREEATRAIVEAKAVMAVELVQGGKEDQAQQILLDAEETATSILAYLVERAKALKAVAVAQAQIGNRVKLREILDAIRKTAGFLGVGSEEQERTLEVLAEAQAEIKAFDEAWETVKSLRYRHEQARAVAAITTMAVKLAEAGEKDAAREIFTNAFQIAAAISDETEKNETLRNIAIALARADEKTEAREILLKITGQDQPKMSDADPNLRALARVLIAKELVGYVEEKEAAQQTFNYAFQAAQAAKVSEESRATWLKVIAVLQAKAGFGDEAIRTANAIQTDRNKHLPDIAAAFIEIENESKYDYFRQFLIPCSYSLDSAYKMCGLLAQVNPQQAGSLADIIC